MHRNPLPHDRTVLLAMVEELTEFINDWQPVVEEIKATGRRPSADGRRRLTLSARYFGFPRDPSDTMGEGEWRWREAHTDPEVGDISYAVSMAKSLLDDVLRQQESLGPEALAADLAAPPQPGRRVTMPDDPDPSGVDPAAGRNLDDVEDEAHLQELYRGLPPVPVDKAVRLFWGFVSELADALGVWASDPNAPALGFVHGALLKAEWALARIDREGISGVEHNRIGMAVGLLGRLLPRCKLRSAGDDPAPPDPGDKDLASLRALLAGRGADKPKVPAPDLDGVSPAATRFEALKTPVAPPDPSTVPILTRQVSVAMFLGQSNTGRYLERLRAGGILRGVVPPERKGGFYRVVFEDPIEHERFRAFVANGCKHPK
jgi:hypothetical protein